MPRTAFSPPAPSTARTQRPGSAKSRTSMGALDFLHANDKMAALLPTIERMAALQRDCAAILPDVFAACEVLLYESDKLVLSTPSAALAAKLKNSLPKLQAGLQKRGWQVSAIRLKVQVGQSVPPLKREKQLSLSGGAVNAFAELEKSLEDSPANAALRAALRAMVSRHSN